MSDSSRPLSGKVALVTGSSRGIGRAIALELAREGADVVVNYRRKAEDARRTAAEIEGHGQRAIAVQANVAEPAEVEALFDAIVREFDGLDLLICNAATGRFGEVAGIPLKAMDLAVSVNTHGTLLCVQAAVPLMKKRDGGRIVVISSPGAHHVFPHYVAVGVSKGAMDTLVRYLAVELAAHNIVVNAVVPGICDTEALRHYLSQETIDDFVARTPMRRTVTPEEVAFVVSFLCRDEAAMICGQFIPIDGGFFLPF